MQNDGQFEPGNRAAWQHGLTGRFAKTGDESALTEPEQSRLIELRRELETPEGVRAVAVRQTSDAELIREFGVSTVKAIADEEGPVKAFMSAMMVRYISAAESARRHRESLERNMSMSKDGGLSADDVLSAIREGKA